MCLKDPPRDARSANRGGPWGRLRQRGSSDSAPARFGVPPLPPPDDCQCAFPIGKKGVRSKRRRPTGHERGRERRSECVGENRVGDSSKGGERQLHRGSSLRIVDQRRSLWSAACSSRFLKKVDRGRAYRLKNARFTNGLSESAVRGVPAWRGADTGKQADAVGKVTSYGDALLTESLQNCPGPFRLISLKLDAIVDEPQCACPSGDIPVPRWTTGSSVA